MPPLHNRQPTAPAAPQRLRQVRHPRSKIRRRAVSAMRCDDTPVPTRLPRLRRWRLRRRRRCAASSRRRYLRQHRYRTQAGRRSACDMSRGRRSRPASVHARVWHCADSPGHYPSQGRGATALLRDPLTSGRNRPQRRSRHPRTVSAHRASRARCPRPRRSASPRCRGWRNTPGPRCRPALSAMPGRRSPH